MENQIDIKHIKDIEAFEALKSEWNTLLARCSNNDAFLTWEWLFSWWKVFKDGKQLWLITAWKANQLVGIAPLMLEKRGKFALGAKILCTLGTPMNDVGGFIVPNENLEILEALVNYIYKQRKNWDILELTEFPLDGPELEALKSIFNRPGFSLIEKEREHFYVNVDKPWDSYYEGLSKKFRKNLRRAERNTSELGEVEICKYQAENLFWDQFETVIHINQHAHYPRLYNSKLEQDFLKELHCRAYQWLNLYLLYIDKKPVAYEYGFLYNNCFEDWRAGFDSRIDPNVSVGKLLSLKVMQNCFDEGCKTVDFMRGAHAYKTEWEPQSRHFEELRIFRYQSILAVIAYYWLRKLKPVLKHLQRSSPNLSFIV